MRTILFQLPFFLVLSFISQLSFAQNSGNSYAKFAKQENLGTTTWTCVYEHSVLDPVLEKTETYRQILQTSDAVSLYLDYAEYQIDSVVNQGDRHKVTTKQALQIYNTYNKKKKNNSVLKDFKKKQLTVREKVFIDVYEYKEKLPEFGWSLKSDTLTVCGFLCRAAEVSFRGRDWTVWYAEEIPASDGPWKFHGLPGLILRAESLDKEISFEAVWVEKQEVAILLDIRNNLFNTTREKLLKQQKTYSENSKQMMEGLVQSGNGELPNRRKHFNPIETDIVKAR